MPLDYKLTFQLSKAYQIGTNWYIVLDRPFYCTVLHRVHDMFYDMKISSQLPKSSVQCREYQTGTRKKCYKNILRAVIKSRRLRDAYYTMCMFTRIVVIPLIDIARHNKFVIVGFKAYKSPWCASIRVNPLSYEILVAG